MKAEIVDKGMLPNKDDVLPLALEEKQKKEKELEELKFKNKKFKLQYIFKSLQIAKMAKKYMTAFNVASISSNSKSEFFSK